MKQKDIVTIVFIVGVSVLVSVLLSKLLISTPKNRQQKVEVTSSITAAFDTPKSDDPVFNKDAINPTQNIQIGANNNATPINGPK
jgi:hypothetical protein